ATARVAPTRGFKGYDGGYRSASKNLFSLFNLSYYLGTAQDFFAPFSRYLVKTFNLFYLF
ncbi:hypothetical protein MUO65_02875, partial [bacterium]|nr:hypothetical protein [bacterium]